MFEHYKQPLLERQAFLLRIFWCIVISVLLYAVTLSIGYIAYCNIEGYSPVDAVLNSVMIMTGVGVIGAMNTEPGKVFTVFYSIFSTIVFFAVLGILFSPLIHRLMHRFHLQIDDNEDSN